MQQNEDVDMQEQQAEPEQPAFDALQADLDGLDALHADEEGDLDVLHAQEQEQGAFQMFMSILLSSARTEVTELLYAEYPDEDSAREGLESATEGWCCLIERQAVLHSYDFTC
jgi:hypothetical protein